MAGRTERFFGNFGWALALASVGGRRGRLGRGGWLCLGHRGGWLRNRPLPRAGTITPVLIAASFFAVFRGAVELRGLPAPPMACGLLARGTAIASLGAGGQKPAFTAFEQTAAAARMVPAQAERPVRVLTGGVGAATVRTAHGRCYSRRSRRREASPSRRWCWRNEGSRVHRRAT